MTELDRNVEESLRELKRRRKTKLALVVAALVVAASGMFAVTSLMYSSTPADVSEERIGEESFM